MFQFARHDTRNLLTVGFKFILLEAANLIQVVHLAVVQSTVVGTLYGRFVFRTATSSSPQLAFRGVVFHEKSSWQTISSALRIRFGKGLPAIAVCGGSRGRVGGVSNLATECVWFIKTAAAFGTAQRLPRMHYKAFSSRCFTKRFPQNALQSF